MNELNESKNNKYNNVEELKKIIAIKMPDASVMEVYDYFGSIDRKKILLDYKLYDLIITNGIDIFDLLDEIYKGNEDVSIISSFFRFKYIFQYH